jgi:hypothetical protein
MRLGFTSKYPYVCTGNTWRHIPKKSYIIITTGVTDAKHKQLDVRGSVHHSTIHKEKSTKMQQCIKILLLFHIIWSSLCFGRHTAHHQEPKTALAASGFAYVEGWWTCRAHSKTIFSASYYVICRLSSCTIIYTLSHKRHDFRGKYINHKICVLVFSTNLSQTFLILRRIQRNIIINVHRASCKLPFNFLRF